jgi:hypothetical protein
MTLGPDRCGPEPQWPSPSPLPRPFPNASRPDCSTSVVSSLGPWRFELLIREASSCSGELLSVVVVPSMRADDRTEQRAQMLLGFIRRAQAWRGLGALAYFIALSEMETNDILSAIRTGLIASESQHVGSAAIAITQWAKLVRDGTLRELPLPLVEQLVATLETRQQAGLQGMLSAAQVLVNENLLTSEHLRRLMKALEKIHLEFRYEDVVDFDSMRSVSISLVRTESVKLALALKDRVADDGTLQAWIEEARTDPLPEVRFSLVNS